MARRICRVKVRSEVNRSRRYLEAEAHTIVSRRLYAQMARQELVGRGMDMGRAMATHPVDSSSSTGKT